MFLKNFKFSVHCLAHVFHLIVEAALSVEPAKIIINDFKSWVNFSHTKNGLNLFKQKFEEKGLGTFKKIPNVIN
jgi:hypothetical protein